jgi:hypothetical protein
MSPSRAARLLTALAVTLLAAPAAASADTFTAAAGDAASLQSALDQAAAHVNAGSADIVSIPAGTYAGNFKYTADPVRIEGAGATATKLTAAANTTLWLDPSASTVSGLSIENTQSSTVGYALYLGNGGAVSDVELRATGYNVYGLFSGDDTSVTRARIVVGTEDTGVSLGDAATTTISETTIEGSGESSSGIKASSAGAIAHVSRLRSLGVAYPLSATFGGALTVRDSLIVLPAGGDGTALQAGDHNNLSNFTSALAAERVTIVGDPGAGHRAAVAEANSAGDDFEVSIRDSVVTGIAQPLGCWSAAGTGRVTADWSRLPGADSSDGAGCTVERTNAVAGTPVFVDAAGGDYRQRHDSPLIDAGDPAPFTSTGDLDGLGRPVGRVDLGAYEYQRRPPVVTAQAAPAAVAPGEEVTFVATAGDPDAGDAPLAYAWSFDDGATATGPSATHAFAAAGSHTGTVTVTDPTDLTAGATATVTVAAPTSAPVPAAPVPAGPAPGSQPGADRTPPAVSLLVRSRLPLAKALRRGIRVTIGCSEACAYKARLTLGRRVVAGKQGATLAGAGTRKLTVKLNRRARRALRRLGGGRLRVRAIATDAAGNAGTAPVRRTTLRALSR